MDKRMLVGIGLLGSLAVGAGCTVVWRNMSRKYIARWEIGSENASESQTRLGGNVCIVPHKGGASELSFCGDAHLFPGLYSAIGVDENRIIKWQDENGFDSGGVDKTGALLAPGYPIFSRLAWTLIQPVYLQGSELSELLDEAKRVSTQSSDPVIQANLRSLSTLAEKARDESKVLRFG